MRAGPGPHPRPRAEDGIDQAHRRPPHRRTDADHRGDGGRCPGHLRDLGQSPGARHGQLRRRRVAGCSRTGNIRTAVSGFLVDQLYANVDVAGEISAALPPRAQPLAGPAAGALRDLAQKVTVELLKRPRVQSLWENANRAAHQVFLKIVNGGGDLVGTEGGVVTLDLRAVLQQLAERTGVGGGLVANIPRTPRS